MSSRRFAVLAFSLFVFLFLDAGEARAQSLTITPDHNPVVAEATVAFVIDPKVRNDGDVVNFDFGDGRTATLKYSLDCGLIGGCDTVTHAYAGAGHFTVTASGTIGGASVTGSLAMTVTGIPLETRLFIATGAHLVGFKGVNWRTDVEVHNFGSGTAAYSVSLLVRNLDNSNPQKLSFTLGAGKTVRYNDVMQSLFAFSGAAALMFTTMDNTLLITSRTYNQLDVGTYGQFVPAFSRATAIQFGQLGRMIMLAHEPSLATGYRTNLGLLNTTPVGITVEAGFYLSTGRLQGTSTFDLQPYEFRQLDRAFELATPFPVDDGYITVRTTTAGATFLAYASVVDNITGDPIYIPAVAPQ